MDRETIKKEIDDIINMITSTPPPNEAATCDWIIKPLLDKLGYEKTEILPQPSEASGQRPDYSIMPNTEHNWFLEAKSYDAPLQEKEINQATTYAYQNGKRWVVLSNGNRWNIYDANETRPEKRLVISIKLEERDKLADFLYAISKSSVIHGGIERYANKCRLSIILDTELLNPSSSCIKTLCSHLRSKHAMRNLQYAELVDFFRELINFEKTIIEPEPIPIPSPSPSGYSLTELAHNVDLSGSMPLSLTLPDGSMLKVKYWADCATRIVQWLATKYAMPTPVKASNSKKYFINDHPVHYGNKAMKRYKEISLNNTTLYIEINRAANNFIKNLYNLCKQVGQNPDDIFIEVLLK